MQVLVINSGSSSIKFRLVEVVEEPTGGLTIRPALLQGAVKGIGSVNSHLGKKLIVFERLDDLGDASAGPLARERGQRNSEESQHGARGRMGGAGRPAAYQHGGGGVVNTPHAAPPTWHDWAPPMPWTCPRCGWQIITRDGAPRCPRCSFREAAD